MATLCCVTLPTPCLDGTYRRGCLTAENPERKLNAGSWPRFEPRKFVMPPRLARGLIAFLSVVAAVLAAAIVILIVRRSPPIDPAVGLWEDEEGERPAFPPTATFFGPMQSGHRARPASRFPQAVAERTDSAVSTARDG